MGNMKRWFIFGFEWWGGLRPTEMTTADGKKLIPLILGIWIQKTG